jgi:membrane protein DedA with SNARE-associated domain/rhodanese-related sulfurtransferase
MMNLGELVHGGAWPLVFLSVFATSLGLPIPAMPVLVMAGAAIQLSYVDTGYLWIRLGITLAAAIAGGTIADVAWFGVGRVFGSRALSMICRLTLSRDICIRRADRFWMYWGPRILLAARFLPGLSLVLIPLAGAMRVRWSTFLLYDCAATALWSAVSLGLGMVFAPQMQVIFQSIHRVGGAAAFIMLGLLISYAGYRCIRRRSFASRLEKRRIGAETLHSRMQDGQPLNILDVRAIHKRLIDPVVIPGAKFADDTDIAGIVASCNAGQTTVIYCSCPNEVSAALLAAALGKAGFRESLPLHGGIEAWLAAGFPVDPVSSLDNVNTGKRGEILFPWPVGADAG